MESSEYIDKISEEWKAIAEKRKLNYSDRNNSNRFAFCRELEHKNLKEKYAVIRLQQVKHDSEQCIVYFYIYRHYNGYNVYKRFLDRSYVFETVEQAYKFIKAINVEQVMCIMSNLYFNYNFDTKTVLLPVKQQSEFLQLQNFLELNYALSFV